MEALSSRLYSCRKAMTARIRQWAFASNSVNVKDFTAQRQKSLRDEQYLYFYCGANDSWMLRARFLKVQFALQESVSELRAANHCAIYRQTLQYCTWGFKLRDAILPKRTGPACWDAHLATRRVTTLSLNLVYSTINHRLHIHTSTVTFEFENMPILEAQDSFCRDLKLILVRADCRRR